MKNRDHVRSKLLKKCKKAQKEGFLYLSLKITNRSDVNFLREYFPITNGEQKTWYTIHLN